MISVTDTASGHNGADVPSDIDSEKTVIGAAIIHSPLLRDPSYPAPDDFHRSAHQVIVRRLLDMDDRQIPIDERTLISELKRFGELEEAGGPAGVGQLTLGVPKVTNIAPYAEPVVATAKLRRRYQQLQQAAWLTLAGRAHEAELLAASAVESARTATRLLDDVEILSIPEPGWLIDRLFPLMGLALLVGPPEVGKTFFAVRTGVSVCTGRSLFGFPVPLAAAGHVIHISAEGQFGIGRRIAAAKLALELPVDESIGYHTWPDVVDLLSPASVAAFVRHGKRVGPRLVTVDTWQRNMPGGDENSTRDTGLAIAGLEQIKRGLQCTVLVLHHPNAEGTRERGNTALRGAMDTVLELTSLDDRLVLSCSKQKDGPKMPAMDLRLILPAPGLPSCTIELANGRDVTDDLSPRQESALACLRGTFRDGATFNEWRVAAGIPERTMYQVRAELERKGHVMKLKNNRFAAVESSGRCL